MAFTSIYGIVDPAQHERLMDEIAKELVAAIDPATGKPAVNKAFKCEDAYKNRGQLDVGPDIVVGYAKGTRCSNESALGGVERDVYTNNTGMWSGDHCMDPDVVPGVLFTSRPLKKPAARLQDLAAAILAEFGIERFPPRE